jgi:hypothetical protein
VVEINDDDDAYKQWLRLHPGGFVLHADTVKLHRNGCDHIDPPGYDSVMLTRKLKVCADDRTELELWALREKHGPARACESCEP